MAITGLVAEYLFAEAASGQSPSTVANEVTANEDLAVTWGASGAWTNENGRGIEFASTAGHAGSAGISSWTSSNLATAMGGGSATVGTIVLVVKDVVGDYNKHRLLQIGSSAGNGNIGLCISGNGELETRIGYENAAAHEIAFFGNNTLSTTGTYVLVFSYDLSRALGSKAKLWIDGTNVSKSTSIGAGNPTSTSLADSGFELAMMNRPSLNRGTGGHILYAAMFDNELSDTDIGTVSTALALDNDTSEPWVTGGDPEVSPNDLTLTASIDSPEITIAPVISPNDLTLTASIDSPEITIAPVISPNDLTLTAEIDSTTLTAPIIANDLTITASIDSTAITVTDTPAISVSPNDIIMTASIDSPEITAEQTVLLSNPTVTNILATSATIGCTASEDGGTIYWAVAGSEFQNTGEDKLRIINAEVDVEGIIACGNMPNTAPISADIIGLAARTPGQHVGWVQDAAVL